MTAQGSLLSSHSDRILLESAFGDWSGSGDDHPFVRPFRYALDPLCLSACLCYAINRWLIKPVCAWPFLHDHFNDLFLIPAALPLLLWLHRQLGLRTHDRPPTTSEILGHLFVWSIVCKIWGPMLFPWAVYDLGDILAYAAGAFVSCLWWNREALANWLRRNRRSLGTRSD